MSKAIQGAVEIAVAVGAVALAAETGGVSMLAFVKAGGLLANSLVGLALSGAAMEAGAIAQALSSNRGMAITTRQPAGFRQIIRGMQRVGGTIVYASTTGSSRRQYNLVIVLATHPCEAITDLYLDGRRVHWQVGSRGNMTMPDGTNFGGTADPGTFHGPNGVAYSFGSEVFCVAHMGDQTAATIDNSDIYANDPTWAPTTHGTPYLGGCTWVYLKLEADTGTFPQFPEIKFTVKGKNDIFDPRTGARGYTSNWALHVADAITDATWGLGDDTVNHDQLIAAANVCDELVQTVAGVELRYTLHWHYDTSLAPGDAIAQMMAGAAGRLSRVGGEWFIWPAYWQGPAFNFDESILLDAMQWTPKRSLSDLANRISGTYTAPNFPYNVAGDLYDAHGYYEGLAVNNFPYAYQPSNFPMYACDELHGYGTGVDVYLTEDGGIYLPEELSLPCVTSITQAQRLAKIALLRKRQQGAGVMTVNMRAWRMMPTSVMLFNSDTFGWVSKQLEVSKVTTRVAPLPGQNVPAVFLQLQVQETDQSVYEWDSETEELTPYDVPAIDGGTSTIVPAPTSLALEDDATTELVTEGGTVIPRLLVLWIPPLDNGVNNGGHIEVQYQFTTGVGDPAPPSTLSPVDNGDGTWTTAWIDAGNTGGQATSTYVQGVAPYRKMAARVRAVRANGGCSVWVVSSQQEYGRSTSNPVAPPGTLTAQALSDGTAQISVANFTAGPVGGLSAVCTPSPNVLPGLAQGEVHEVYYIDPNFTGGSIAPIATQNPADYFGKPGYFLIGYITTPTYHTRYQPSQFSDLGSSTTQSPAAAYDNNTTTAAAVIGTWSTSGAPGSYVVSQTTGHCVWFSFPKLTVTADKTLHVISQASGGGSSPTGPGTPSGAITVNIGGSSSTLQAFSGSVAQADYTMTIPSGTDLSTISVEITAQMTAATPPGGGSFGISEVEIYIE